MATDSYNVWSVRDLVIVLSVCSVAAVWVLRNKSPRERFVLILAGVIVVIANGFILFALRPGNTWRDLLPLYDVLYWVAFYLSIVFNRMVRRHESGTQNADKGSAEREIEPPAC